MIKNLNDSNKTRVAFVAMHSIEHRVPPFGLLYVATYLDKKLGDSVEIKIIDKNFEDIVTETLDFEPDIIGISCMTLNYADAVNFASTIKKNIPVPIVIGGVHVSTLPKSIDESFDLGVVGEGEETFYDLVTVFQQYKGLDADLLANIKGLVFWHNGNLKFTGSRELIQNLDEIPFPDYSYLRREYFDVRPTIGVGFRRLGWVLTSRGCPYKCTFCSTKVFWDKLRYHSPESVQKHILHLNEKYGSEHILIMDDLFTINKKRLMHFLNMFSNGIASRQLTFSAQARVDTISDKICSILRKLNVVILQFGFESGSDKVLKSLKGGQVSVQKNIDAVKVCKKNNILAFGSFMMGMPGETLEDMKDTYRLIKHLKSTGAGYIFSFVCTPLPGTVFWDIAKKKGTVADDMDFKKLDLENTEKSLLLEDGIDKDEFSRVFKKTRYLLRGQKYKMLFEFIVRDPLFILNRFINEPLFILRKVYLFIFRK